MEALFTIAKYGSNPSVRRQMNGSIWGIYVCVCIYHIYAYIFITEYYSAIKKNVLLPFATTLMDLSTEATFRQALAMECRKDQSDHLADYRQAHQVTPPQPTPKHP